MSRKRDETIKEMLARLCTDMGWLKRGFANHLAHHEKYTFWAITAALSAVVGLVFTVFINLIKANPKILP